MREEGPLSGWRPEGLALSNRRRPRGRDGGAPCTGGRAGDLSITESAGGNTYHTKAPRRDPAGAGRPRRGAGPGWREPIRRAAPGARAGSPRETQTHGSERTPKPRCSSAFRCDGRRTSPRPGLPHLCGLDPPPPPPRLRRGERGDGCWEARAAPPSPPASSPHAPPVSPPPLITAGWLGEEGRWLRRSLGGRLPLTREPPWEQ